MKFGPSVRRGVRRMARRILNTLGVQEAREWLRSQLSDDHRPQTLQDLMELPPSYASVRVICDAMATSPIRLMERTGENEFRKAEDHPLWPLLTYRGPTKLLTTPRFISLMQAWLCTEHDALAVLRRDGWGDVEKMIPLPRECIVRTRENLRMDSLVRTVRWPDQYEEVLMPSDLLWLQGFGITPLVGLRIVDLMANSIGRYRATDRTLDTVIGSGTSVKGFIAVQGWDEDDVRKGRQQLQQWSGPDAAGKLKLISTDEGHDIKYVRMGMTAEEARLPELRMQALQDQGRIQVVSPTQIGDLSHGTYSNVEQEGRRFLNQTLGFWVTGWRHGLAKWLLHPDEQPRFEFHIDTSALTMGSMLERYQAYQAAVQSWLTPNEIRSLEDLPAVPDGDQILRPLNMGPAGAAPEGDNDNGD